LEKKKGKVTSGTTSEKNNLKGKTFYDTQLRGERGLILGEKEPMQESLGVELRSEASNVNSWNQEKTKQREE